MIKVFFKKMLDKIPANVKVNLKSIGFGSFKVLVGAVVMLIVALLIMYICSLS